MEGSVERLFLLIDGVSSVSLGSDSKAKLVDLRQPFPHTSYNDKLRVAARSMKPTDKPPWLWCSPKWWADGLESVMASPLAARGKHRLEKTWPKVSPSKSRAGLNKAFEHEDENSFSRHSFHLPASHWPVCVEAAGVNRGCRSQATPTPPFWGPVRAQVCNQLLGWGSPHRHNELALVSSAATDWEPE